MKHIEDVREVLAGTFAVIPPQLGTFDVQFHKLPAGLIGFPSEIPYQGTRAGLSGGTSRLFEAVYKPVFDSWRETDDSTELTYGWEMGTSPFRVVVLQTSIPGVGMYSNAAVTG